MAHCTAGRTTTCRDHAAPNVRLTAPLAGVSVALVCRQVYACTVQPPAGEIIRFRIEAFRPHPSTQQTI
jgi:hypothetical protein